MPNDESNLLDESKDIENPAVPLLDIADAEKAVPLLDIANAEKHDKLLSFKASLLSVGHTSTYASSCFKSCMLVNFFYGVIATVGSVPYLINLPNDSSQFKIVQATFGTGIISLGATLVPYFSSKCRAYTVGKLSKPLSLPVNFKLTELNQLLSSVGLNPIEEKNLSSTKDLQGILATIEVAIEQTETGKLLALGNAVKTGLQSAGFFSDPRRLILNYLITNKEILDRLTLTVKK